ncbi:hypothetical protein [Streptomyces sp. NPDC050388]|uniref:hypothetical protein n=1 Tax=Streptomyces sp. NPDC050388 TaxID=3155781 RepID=UPI0034322CEE
MTAGRKAIGALLTVDPGAPAQPPHPRPEPSAATLVAGEHALVVSALADDYVTLRQRLDASLTALDTFFTGESEALAGPSPVGV